MKSLLLTVVVEASPLPTLADKFPQGLAYKSPASMTLFHTSGRHWTFQRSTTLETTLRDRVRRHYSHFKARNIDKTNMPLYLFLCGAGTGKSRNAYEFHKMTMAVLSDDDDELREKLKTAWVFHTSMENGTSLRPDESDPRAAIGMRMLLQLKGGNFDTLRRSLLPPDPWDVLELVSKHEKTDLRDASVILIVDGLQALMNTDKDGHGKESHFYRTLASIGDLAIQGTFLIPCCTATCFGPAKNALSQSNQARVYLPVASLTPPTITRNGKEVDVFDTDDTLVKILLDDCGGHGRAIEIMSDMMREVPDWKTNLSKLMKSIREGLETQYEKAFSITDAEIDFIVKAALSHKLLKLFEVVPSIGKPPDNLAAPGLIWFEEAEASSGYLQIPYIWLWLFAGRLRSIFPGFNFDDYGDLASVVDPTLPSLCHHTNFVKFVVGIRRIKSLVFEDKSEVSMSEVHRGARICGDLTFFNHHLISAVADKQTKTKSTDVNRDSWIIETNIGTVDLREHKYILINQKSASAGDTFLSLQTRSGSLTESHQFKLYGENTSFTQNDFKTEWNKAAGDNDYFFLFTTKSDLDWIELPHHCGIVSGDNWDNYFGPFAGRAYRYKSLGGGSESKSSMSQMTSMSNAFAPIGNKRPLQSSDYEPPLKKFGSASTSKVYHQN